MKFDIHYLNTALLLVIVGLLFTKMTNEKFAVTNPQYADETRTMFSMNEYQQMPQP